MQHHRRAVELGQQVDMLGAGNAAGDAGALVFIAQRLAREELRPAVGELDDRGRVHLLGGLHDGIDGTGIDYIHRRHGELLCLGQLKQGLQIVSRGDSRLYLRGIHGHIPIQ